MTAQNNLSGKGKRPRGTGGTGKPSPKAHSQKKVKTEPPEMKGNATGVKETDNNNKVMLEGLKNFTKHVRNAGRFDLPRSNGKERKGKLNLGEIFKIAREVHSRRHPPNSKPQAVPKVSVPKESEHSKGNGGIDEVLKRLHAIAQAPPMDRPIQPSSHPLPLNSERHSEILFLRDSMTRLHGVVQELASGLKYVLANGNVASIGDSSSKKRGIVQTENEPLIPVESLPVQVKEKAKVPTVTSINNTDNIDNFTLRCRESNLKELPDKSLLYHKEIVALIQCYAKERFGKNGASLSKIIGNYKSWLSPDPGCANGAPQTKPCFKIPLSDEDTEFIPKERCKESLSAVLIQRELEKELQEDTKLKDHLKDIEGNSLLSKYKNLISKRTNKRGKKRDVGKVASEAMRLLCFESPP